MLTTTRLTMQRMESSMIVNSMWPPMQKQTSAAAAAAVVLERPVKKVPYSAPGAFAAVLVVVASTLSVDVHR